MAWNYIYYGKTHPNNGLSVSSASCMSFTNSEIHPYYILPEFHKGLTDNHRTYLKDVNDTFGCVEIIDQKDFHKDGRKINSYYNLIEITPDEKRRGYYRLFINQLVRYVVLEEAQETINTYCTLKEQFPDKSFWFLFHVANLISFTTKYEGYYQPFNTLRKEVIYDVERVKNNLYQGNGNINNSTTTSNTIPVSVINNLKETFSKKDWDGLKDELIELYQELDSFKCVDSTGIYWLTKDKEYTGYIKGDMVKVLNDDFCYRKYKGSRFKKIDK